MAWTPLETAVGNNKPIEEVQALIDANPDFVTSDRGKKMIALRIACEGKVSALIIKALIDAYKGGLKDIKFPNTTPLHAACVPSEIWYEYENEEEENNFLLAIPYLIEACPRMASYRNSIGFTPLDIAVGNYLPLEYMKMIIDATDTKIFTEKNHLGWSPLEKAKEISVNYPVLCPPDIVEYMENKLTPSA